MELLANKWRIFIEKKVFISLFVFYNSNIILCAGIFYFLVPVLLNYFPDLVEIPRSLGSPSYLFQFIMLIVVVLIIGNAILLISIRKLLVLYKMPSLSQEESIKQMHTIRKLCFLLPHRFYLMQIFITIIPTLILTILITYINQTNYYFIPKILVLLYSYMAFSGVIFHIYSKKIMNEILQIVKSRDYFPAPRQTIRAKFIAYMGPVVFASVLITALVGYSRIIAIKGEYIYQLYQYKLRNMMNNISPPYNEKKLSSALKTIAFNNPLDTWFIKQGDSPVKMGDGNPPSKVFALYVNKFSDLHQGHAYSEDGEIQGTVLRFQDMGINWSIGVRFVVVNTQSILVFSLTLLIIFIINITLMIYFSHYISKEIFLVADRLNRIALKRSIEKTYPIEVLSNDEIGDLTMAFNQVQEVFHSQLETISTHNQIMKEDLELGRAVQSLVLGNIPPNTRELKFGLVYCPYSAVSGDLYDVYRIDNNKVAILIGDVMGHGTSAALITTMVKMIFRYSMQQEEITGKICGRVNKQLCSHLEGSEIFITVVLMIYDESSGKLEYTVAGHSEPYLYNSARKSFIRLSTKDTVIGMMNHISYNTKSENMHPGDKVILFTDGLIETKNPRNDLYSKFLDEDIKNCIDQTEIETLPETILSKAQQFSIHGLLEDDVTILALERIK